MGGTPPVRYLPCVVPCKLYFFMVHNKKYLPGNLGDRELVIYGHSHKYEERQVEGRTWLNPGSCGPRRFNQPITMAVVRVEENGGFSVEKVEIPHGDR